MLSFLLFDIIVLPFLFPHYVCVAGVPVALLLCLSGEFLELPQLPPSLNACRLGNVFFTSAFLVAPSSVPFLGVARNLFTCVRVLGFLLPLFVFSFFLAFVCFFFD